MSSISFKVSKEQAELLVPLLDEAIKSKLRYAERNAAEHKDSSAAELLRNATALRELLNLFVGGVVPHE